MGLKAHSPGLEVRGSTNAKAEDALHGGQAARRKLKQHGKTRDQADGR